MNLSPQILKLQPQQRDLARQVIVRAFRDDPLLTHLTPNARFQARLLDWFARTGLKYGEGYGRVDTNPEVSGVAVWFEPGAPAMAAAGLWRAAVRLPLEVGWSCFLRFVRFLRFAERVHKGIVSGDHWHLFILVVDPERQGQGWGAELLRPVLAEADASGQACYLETTNPRAVPFYRKNGFDIAHHAVLEPRGPSFWGLLRNPAPNPGNLAE